MTSIRLLVLGAVLVLPAQYAFSAPKAIHQKNSFRAAHQAAPSASNLMVLQGSVVDVKGSVVTLRTPNHGPGLTHGPGIHSHLIVAGREYRVATAESAFQTAEGVVIPRRPIKPGDNIVVVVDAPRADAGPAVEARVIASAADR